MTKEKRAFVQSYIDQLKSFDEELSLTVDQGIYYENNFYELIRQVESIFKSEIPTIGDNLMYRTNCAQTDANTLAGILQLYLLNDNDYKEDATETPRVNSDTPIIFLSHKSSDKKYGDALRNFLIGLGVRKEQLIYTSHPLHKIPLDANIFDYLRNNINRKVFMIILWSEDYLNSPACLNEMGAAWVVKSDYTNIYVPTFDFGNTKYHECAIDTRKMGAILNGNQHCRQSMIELKDKIQELFSLTIDEKDTNYLLEVFIKEIS